MQNKIYDGSIVEIGMSASVRRELSESAKAQGISLIECLYREIVSPARLRRELLAKAQRITETVENKDGT